VKQKYCWKYDFQSLGFLQELGLHSKENYNYLDPPNIIELEDYVIMRKIKEINTIQF
jgi:hypothetical protein